MRRDFYNGLSTLLEAARSETSRAHAEDALAYCLEEMRLLQQEARRRPPAAVIVLYGAGEGETPRLFRLPSGGSCGDVAVIE